MSQLRTALLLLAFLPVFCVGAWAQQSHPAASPAKEYEAWFDVQTGLPTGCREGGKAFAFQFSATPEALQLPLEYQSAVEKYEAELRHAGLLP